MYIAGRCGLVPVAAECYGEFSCDFIKKRGNEKNTVKNRVKFPLFVMESV